MAEAIPYHNHPNVRISVLGETAAHRPRSSTDANSSRKRVPILTLPMFTPDKSWIAKWEESLETEDLMGGKRGTTLHYGRRYKNPGADGELDNKHDSQMEGYGRRTATVSAAAPLKSEKPSCTII